MKYNLDGLTRILLQFQSDLEKKQHFYDTTRALNPDFSPVSEDNWRKELARCWIYGTDDIGTVLMAPLPKIPYQSEASRSLASTHYSNWQTDIEKNATPDSEYIEYFLNPVDFADYHLEEPNKGETLYDYIIRLRDIVENKEKLLFFWERALSGFLNHLRQSISKRQIAFLELIFPEDMEIRRITTLKEVKTGTLTSEFQEVPCGQIARKIPPTVFPIYIMNAADIIRELVNTVICGRQNAKLGAAETLGMCWICLTSSRLRLPIALNDLFNLPIKALENPSDKNLPSLSLPTIFDWLPVPCSETIWNFLKALSEIPGAQPRSRIFQSTDESLYRVLRRTIQKLDFYQTQGEITFKTFLSQPVEFDHRYQPQITH